jgi:hypothetical protein
MLRSSTSRINCKPLPTKGVVRSSHFLCIWL